MLKQACSQGVIVSKDQFEDNCVKRNIRSFTACFDALSYLCEYLLELLMPVYSWIVLRFHSMRTSCISPIIKSVAINKDLSQPLRVKEVRISETRHNRGNPITHFYRIKEEDGSERPPPPPPPFIWETKSQNQNIFEKFQLNRDLQTIPFNMMYNMSMLRHWFSNEWWGGGGGAPWTTFLS